MRNKLLFLALLFGGLGFAAPVFWIIAPIFLVLAIMAASPGRRLDGKRRTGGLLGWIFDDLADAKHKRDSK